MPNNFVAAGMEQLSSAMVAGLFDGGVLVNTIYRDAEASFQVGKGDTVTIREPLSIAATNFTGVAVVSDVTEGKISIPINHQPYNQVKLTAKEETLYIEDLVREVILPGTAGILEYIDAAIAAFLATTTGAATGTAAGGWTSGVSAARQQLSANGLPAGDRWLAAAPDVVSGLLTDQIVTVGNLPSAGTALAEGYIGRLHGFNIVESNFVPPATAYAYHRTGVAGIFRTPVVPSGAAAVGSSTLRGLSAQVIYSYDNTLLSDVITQHTLFGLGASDVSFDQRVLAVTLV